MSAEIRVRLVKQLSLYVIQSFSKLNEYFHQPVLLPRLDADGGGISDALNLLSIVSDVVTICKELCEDVRDLQVTIRCSLSLSCLRFSISFCQYTKFSLIIINVMIIIALN